MTQIILTWLALMIFGGLINTGGYFGFGAAGALLGLFLLWGWVIGCIYGTEIYHQGKPPGWMIWLANDPKEESWFLWSRHPKFWKIISLSVTVILLVISAYASSVKESPDYLSFCISLVITWLLGVMFAEPYFKRNYKRDNSHI